MANGNLPIGWKKWKVERGKWVYDEKSVMANGNLPINWKKRATESTYGKLLNHIKKRSKIQNLRPFFIRSLF